MDQAHFDKISRKLTKILGDAGVKEGSSPQHIIVIPKTTDDVARILRLAESEEIPVFPFREMAWVNIDADVGVAIIMNTSSMNGIFEIDEENLSVTVGPGVQWKSLYQALSKRKYSIGAYPDSSFPRVGDWIDCGGSGIGSYGNGSAGDQVRTMEVVLPDGRVIDTGFRKVLSNSSGYNLNGLFIGADSTLGVITKVTLKMVPKPQETLPLYYSFPRPKELNGALLELVKLKTTPLNISFFGKNHIETLRMFGKEIPDIPGLVLNVTLAGLKSVLSHQTGDIDRVMEKHGATAVAEEFAGALWSERFFDFKARADTPVPFFAEVLIPLTYLSELVENTEELIGSLKCKGAVMGILSDRSTVSFTPYILTDKATKTSRISSEFAKKVGDLSLEYHGRPMGSTLFLVSRVRNVYKEGINTILDIKSAIDPHDIMNPHILK